MRHIKLKAYRVNPDILAHLKSFVVFVYFVISNVLMFIVYDYVDCRVSFYYSNHLIGLGVLDIGVYEYSIKLIGSRNQQKKERKPCAVFGITVKRMTDCSPVVECEVDSLERSPAPRVLSDAEGLELLLGQAGGRSARQLVREAGQVRGHRGLPHTGVQLRGRGGGACRQ